eukprot:TRINITY_DN24841_c0_g1_i1.p1 TRINITY_DN24841_c0_g1~~TRINITY_DN24841_c0_g1_i1.p1  ORF type:complete len:597 (-),score=117.91 TRINITY_DN24841_c0_g1_i1:37-1827(-)
MLQGWSRWLPILPALFFTAAAQTTITTTYFWTQTTRTVTTVPEYTFYSGDWSDCSETCTAGTRIREVYCIRTCSVPRLCPSANEFKCQQWNQPKPSASEYCYGSLMPCPDTTTLVTSTLTTATNTITTVTTVTERPADTTRKVADGFECAPPGDDADCMPKAMAELRCGFCRCCRPVEETTEAPAAGPLETAPPEVQLEVAAPATEDSTLTIIIAGSCGGVGVVVLILLLLWWRSCIRRAEKARLNRERREFQKAQTMPVPTPEPETRFQKDRAKTDVIYDRKLGEGVASAAPGGYYESDPDWWTDPEAGIKIETPNSRSKSMSRKESEAQDFFAAGGERFWSQGEQPKSAPSSPSRPGARRASAPPAPEHRAEDSDECLTPPGGRSPQRDGPSSSPSGKLPKGFAAASRAFRREGKEAPDWGGFEDEEPPPMPGQANTESGIPPKGSSRRGMATPPRANEDAGLGGTSRPQPQHAKTSSGFHRSSTAHSPRNKEQSGNERSGAKESSGSSRESPGGESFHDPRVAREKEASSEANDLIAKVDLELDQTMGKDLETRRRTFKNLMLKWHPDKNQEEELATEVFRHLMARRGRYLEA